MRSTPLTHDASMHYTCHLVTVAASCQWWSLSQKMCGSAIANAHVCSASGLLLPSLQDGYGYYSGSSQICPAGTYNGKGNMNPCTQ
jgi:hypothetical protein